MVESTELFPVVMSDYPETSRRGCSKRQVLRDGLIIRLEREALEELLGLFQQDPGVFIGILRFRILLTQICNHESIFFHKGAIAFLKTSGSYPWPLTLDIWLIKSL